MTEITFHITLPNVTLPRGTVKALAIGVLIGAVGMAGVYTALYNPAAIRAAWTYVFGPAKGEMRLLSNRQKKAFKTALPLQQEEGQEPHRLRVVYASACASCAANANAVAELMNQTPGWQVVSMSGLEAKTIPQGLALQTNAASPPEGVGDLKAALAAARLSFTTGETQEDIPVLSFNAP